MTAVYERQSDGGHPLQPSPSAGFTFTSRVRGKKVYAHKAIPNLPEEDLMRFYYGATLSCIR